MAPFFPHETVAWRTYEPGALRRFTFSVVATAAVTGVVLRLYRAIVLTHGPSGSWLYLGGAVAVAVVLFFGMATLHLGNYTVRRWLWRVPAFAVIEAVAEMATSAVLIAAGREPLGTGRAHFRNWWGMAAEVVAMRLVTLTLFAVVLAGIVTLVRYAMLRRDAATAGATTDGWEEDEGR